MRVKSKLSPSGNERTYIVEGQLFFVSSERFQKAFDFQEVLEKVVIDVKRAHFWDLSAVGVLDKVVLSSGAKGLKLKSLDSMKRAEPSSVNSLYTINRKRRSF